MVNENKLTIWERLTAKYETVSFIDKVTNRPVNRYITKSGKYFLASSKFESIFWFYLVIKK